MLLLAGFVNFFSAVWLNAFSQIIHISVEGNNITVGDVLRKIEDQSDFIFTYNSDAVNTSRIVSIKMGNRNISDILNDLFAGENIGYTINDKHIVLYKKYNPTTKDVRRISGIVIDDFGVPLIGANVMVKGTSDGTITDMNGNFTLEVSDDAILEVSYIGYLPNTLKVKGNDIVVILKEDTQKLDEIVVVGYGIQKKLNVIGSVVNIGSEKLNSRSTPQLSNALTGHMAGVTVIQRSGQPGYSDGEIRVRGVGSFGATPSALVLIDGIPGNMNELNMEDIESVSVLKDASTAAIYGARAANGVILVTTKTGKKGKLSVNYNGYIGTSVATAFPKFVDTWRYCELYNQAVGNEVYSEEDILNYKNGTGDPDKYANARYLEEVLSNNGMQTGHDISLSGGSDSFKYMLSLGTLYQKGLVDKNNYSRYNTRINLINSLFHNLKLTTRFSARYSNNDEPAVPGGDDASDMLGAISKAVRMPGLTPSVLSDGSFALGKELHGTPPGWIKSESFYNKKVYNVNVNMSLDYMPVTDFKLSLIGAYNNLSEDEKMFHSTQKLSDGSIMGPSSLSQSADRYIYKTFQSTAAYTKNISDHSVSLLAGYSWEQEDYYGIEGSRDEFPSNDLPYLNSGSPDNQNSYGSAYGWAIQSVFGRFQYNFKEKYLFESTMRYDGSSRFPSNKRYGFFPSAAIGWRISEESFFKKNENLNWISSLKLKSSWGRLGNQNISNYPFQSVYELGENYPFGNNISQGAAINVSVDPNLKWEETETIDAGLESILFNGKLSFNISYFHRYTYDILYKPSSSVSLVLGKDISQMNTGELKNIGWEFELGHNNTIGHFSYEINGNLTIINNNLISLGVGNIKQMNGLVGDGSELFVGYPIQLYYGYKTDGVFINEDEISQWYDLTAINPKPQVGDIRYVDISGPDGKPDGKVDPNYDRVPLGSRIPKFTFGADITLRYKNIDCSMLLQGVSGVSGRLDSYAGYALCNQGNIQVWQADGAFDIDNPERYPDYPRIEDMGNSIPPNYLLSDFWILNASYLRLKNIQIGYTFPRNILSSVGITNLRLYAQAENLFSIHNYRDGWDPEINTSGKYYPILSTYTLGVNLKF